MGFYFSGKARIRREGRGGGGGVGCILLIVRSVRVKKDGVEPLLHVYLSCCAMGSCVWYVWDRAPCLVLSEEGEKKNLIRLLQE